LNPLVSIITPSFNQSRYLEQTIRSVLEQDDARIEYIVVDGGSTDGSVDVIKRHADKLAWWVSEKDNGQADAINKGFARATGGIVAWINSDDYYLPGAIRAAVEALANNPQAGMVYGGTIAVDENGRRINLPKYAQWSLEDLLTFNIIGQPAVFMRRSVLDQTGFLDLSYHFLLDHQLWVRMASLAPMIYVPQRWAAGRFHSAAKNIARAAEFGAEAYRILRWAETQPQIAPTLAQIHRQAWAGAHRINARYLLDGGQNWPAFKSYMRSLGTHAPTALVEWKRIIFSAMTLIGLGGLRHAYYRLRKMRFDR
jgi:glycosyltransferase involved in cell wall biosynthesis